MDQAFAITLPHGLFFMKRKGGDQCQGLGTAGQVCKWARACSLASPQEGLLIPTQAPAPPALKLSSLLAPPPQTFPDVDQLPTLPPSPTSLSPDFSPTPELSPAGKLSQPIDIWAG